jgi:hypothetical protein
MNTALAKISVMRFLLFRPPIPRVPALANEAALTSILAELEAVATAAMR